MREMKDSGVRWIGLVPTSWSCIRLKYVTEIMSGCPFDSSNFSSEGGFPLIRIRDITSGKAGTFFNGEFDEKYIIHNDDLLVGMDGDFSIRWWNGGDALLNQRCCKVDVSDELNRRFLYYFLPFRLQWVNSLTYATTVKHLSTTDIMETTAYIPSLTEQSRIVAYLDRRCATIDALIANQQQQIDKLKQYKQAVITEAVTRGLDPNVRLKDSGNRRIGMIPHHWQLNRTKTFIQNVSSGLSAITSNESGELCGKYVLRTSSVSSGFLKIEERKPVFWNAEDRLICPVERNTIIMSRMNTASMVGYCAYVDKDYLDTYLPDKLWKIKLRSGMHPKYLWYLVNAPVSHCYFASLATGTSASMLNISMEDFQALEIAVPPSDEQKAIIHYLDTKCAQIDALIALKQQKADKLAQYKKSLIYEVVTGKREV